MPSGPERDNLIVRLRSEGKTLQQIADVVGLTRERVRQITIEFGSHADGATYHKWLPVKNPKGPRKAT